MIADSCVGQPHRHERNDALLFRPFASVTGTSAVCNVSAKLLEIIYFCSFALISCCCPPALTNAALAAVSVNIYLPAFSCVPSIHSFNSLFVVSHTKISGPLPRIHHFSKMSLVQPLAQCRRLELRACFPARSSHQQP